MSSCLVDLLRGFLFPKGPIWDIQGLTHAHARDWLAQAHCCFLLTKMLPDQSASLSLQCAGISLFCSYVLLQKCLIFSGPAGPWLTC